MCDLWVPASGSFLEWLLLEGPWCFSHVTAVISWPGWRVQCTAGPQPRRNYTSGNKNVLKHELRLPTETASRKIYKILRFMRNKEQILSTWKASQGFNTRSHSFLVVSPPGSRDGKCIDLIETEVTSCKQTFLLNEKPCKPKSVTTVPP